MSGGRFDYVQYKFDDVAESISGYIERETKNADDPLPDDIVAKFAEAARTCEIAAAMVQRVDWLLSGDDGYDSFRDRWIVEVERLKKASTFRYVPKHRDDSLLDEQCEWLRQWVGELMKVNQQTDLVCQIASESAVAQFRKRFEQTAVDERSAGESSADACCGNCRNGLMWFGSVRMCELRYMPKYRDDTCDEWTPKTQATEGR